MLRVIGVAPGLFSIGGETEAARVARRRATLGVAL